MKSSARATLETYITSNSNISARMMFYPLINAQELQQIISTQKREKNLNALRYPLINVQEFQQITSTALTRKLTPKQA
jgi:hypothetical protein